MNMLIFSVKVVQVCVLFELSIFCIIDLSRSLETEVKI